MAKVMRNSAQPPLVMRLDDPGMTPLLRAGLGGLAASLRSMADAQRNWHEGMKVGAGRAAVDANSITLEWGNRPPKETLCPLFKAAFQTQKQIIYLPGMFDPHRPWKLAIGVEVQAALKQTFLQHGKSTIKASEPRVVELEVDSERRVQIMLQPYKSFAHQSAWEDVVKAFSAPVALAGWANPGAIGRHNAIKATELAYSPAQALAVLFALVGTLSFQISTGGGCLVIPEPADLIAYAEMRPSLTPKTATSVYVAGASDAALSVSVEIAARSLHYRDGVVRGLQTVTLRSTPWASQQKSRVATARVIELSSPGHRQMLEHYQCAASALPAKLRIKRDIAETKQRKARKQENIAGTNTKSNRQKSPTKENENSIGYFVTTSALRGFVADNLARGRPWYEGFATTRTPTNPPRAIHLVREPKNLGALFPEERKGLYAMIEQTNDLDRLFISSLHSALRHRFGAIFEETKSLPLQTRRNRMRGERERWRLVFAKAKTHEQVRAGLSDLWSRAGTVPELRERLSEVLPMLRETEWQRARDLALVALASYRGKGTEEAETDATEEPEEEV